MGAHNASQHGEARMNAASLSRSDRLRRVAALLRRGKEYSTMEIIQQAGVAAVSAAISELRCNGMDIRCQRRGDVWYYRRTA